MVNDLGIYFKGLQVAAERKDIDDIVAYLNNMKKEIDYSLGLLGSIRKDPDKRGSRRQTSKNICQITARAEKALIVGGSQVVWCCYYVFLIKDGF